MRGYLCEAASVEGFVQKLALDYVQYGYLFYVPGSIPEGKDPEVTDRSVIDRYEINVSRWTRYRRERAGLANVHYLRFGRFFVIIASHGRHLFREREKESIRDIRESPVRFAGYSIGYKRAQGDGSWHPSVHIEEEVEYPLLKRRFLRQSTRWEVEDFIRAFRALPYEPYAPVVQQELELLRQVNQRREAASLEAVPATALRFWRRSVRPFGRAPWPW
jgi:hypothetical protein